MKQFDELKSHAGEALLLFRMGDFYELFGEDAITASRVLGITLTSRDKKKENPIPMAGVPHHSAESYIQKLLRAGYKVAIGEQVEDPAQAKGIVRREIVRTFSPAVRFGQDDTETRYLAVIVHSRTAVTLACVEPSTGEMKLGELKDIEKLEESLQSLPIYHLLTLGEEKRLPKRAEILIEELPKNYIHPKDASSLATEVGGNRISTVEAQIAIGILVRYLKRSQKVDRLEHLQPPRELFESSSLRLGPQSAKHLDLLPNREGSPNLFEIIDHTKSALGARRLKRWLLSPLVDPQAIRERQGFVREIAKHDLSFLGNGYDLERILARVATGLANPKDTYNLGQTIALILKLRSKLKDSKPLKRFSETLARLEKSLYPLGKRILEAQKDEPPHHCREGGIFKKGLSKELDRLIDLGENGEKWLIDLEAREKKATGIPTLKVRYNRVFGYYIEVTKTHSKSVPAHYQRKQSMVNAERFFTEELKKFEDEILSSSSRQKQLELKLFDELLVEIQSHSEHIQEYASIWAEVDAIQSLSRLSQNPGWRFPEIDSGLEIHLKASRHPLVDHTSEGEFVPNDVSLSPETRMTLLITGPNMGGKSTVMRQVATLVLMGQMGAPLPVESARWGSFSSLYTRIGAHDAIAQGQSTFMVEMSELAQILHEADERSLIVLDEIGRGTSTYDGISVAWATLEWISQKIQARTLFATHYHELTRLAQQIPNLANAHMAVAVDPAQKNSLRFLYELKEGATNESFGVYVARIAGLPGAVVNRSWRILSDLEKGSLVEDALVDRSQLSLFNDAVVAVEVPETKEDPLRAELGALNLDQLTPLEALNTLSELKKKFES